MSEEKKPPGGRTNIPVLPIGKTEQKIKNSSSSFILYSNVSYYEASCPTFIFVQQYQKSNEKI